ncbi:hypothetical protein IQ264_22365 [Phormidium sp. LEGE 05292]|uniref:hypothetical protein n=1 Tax=[Phormidium] sp. LEGE 05292 TaxID=767427 RepID=UPI00187FED7D|nr:hypothetical protein [Phormidium sp. LEGE 05292]MBE9228171.1 hypothetical protein [Phormidium sp. LEGE 05292]
METLAYLHCASTCEEIAPVEPVFGEDDAYLFDGLISVKRLSSLALLGLLPLSVALGVMANPNVAEAGGWYGRCGGGCGHGGRGYVVTKHIFVKKHIFVRKVVWIRPLRYRHFHCYRPRPICGVYRGCGGYGGYGGYGGDGYDNPFVYGD